MNVRRTSGRLTNDMATKKAGERRLFAPIILRPTYAWLYKGFGAS
ncbi:MAG: hypothetical protein ACI831_000825 [Candidatus Azotimanducaceae bacterium]|jgi:hypothetical protein